MLLSVDKCKYRNCDRELPVRGGRGRPLKFCPPAEGEKYGCEALEKAIKRKEGRLPSAKQLLAIAEEKVAELHARLAAEQAKVESVNRENALLRAVNALLWPRWPARRTALDRLRARARVPSDVRVPPPARVVVWNGEGGKVPPIRPPVRVRVSADGRLEFEDDAT